MQVVVVRSFESFSSGFGTIHDVALQSPLGARIADAHHNHNHNAESFCATKGIRITVTFVYMNYLECLYSKVEIHTMAVNRLHDPRVPLPTLAFNQ